jgi:hypothetical protein
MLTGGQWLALVYVIGVALVFFWHGWTDDGQDYSIVAVTALFWPMWFGALTLAAPFLAISALGHWLGKGWRKRRNEKGRW